MFINTSLANLQGEFSLFAHSSQRLALTSLDCARGVVSAGKTPWSFAVGGQSRVLEVAGLVLQTLAYIEQRSSGLGVSEYYWMMDQTEKAAASYRLGMAFAKLVFELELGVPWLQHLDPLIRENRALRATTSRVRGDMAGLFPSGQWIVVEAKGRTRNPPDALISDAKQQASNVATIDGAAVRLHCGCVTNLGDRPIVVTAEDPPPGSHGERVEISLDTFFAVYYEPILMLKQSGARSYSVSLPFHGSTSGFSVFDLAGSGLHLGIADAVMNWLQERQGIPPVHHLRKVSLPISSGDTLFASDISIGLDGYCLIDKRPR